MVDVSDVLSAMRNRLRARIEPLYVPSLRVSHLRYGSIGRIQSRRAKECGTTAPTRMGTRRAVPAQAKGNALANVGATRRRVLDSGHCGERRIGQVARSDGAVGRVERLNQRLTLCRSLVANGGRTGRYRDKELPLNAEAVCVERRIVRPSFDVRTSVHLAR